MTADKDNSAPKGAPPPPIADIIRALPSYGLVEKAALFVRLFKSMPQSECVQLLYGAGLSIDLLGSHEREAYRAAADLMAQDAFQTALRTGRRPGDAAIRERNLVAKRLKASDSRLKWSDVARRMLREHNRPEWWSGRATRKAFRDSQAGRPVTIDVLKRIGHALAKASSQLNESDVTD
jgi:hypothetical protein